MECEKCPVSGYCVAYQKAEEDNRYSYHHQNVIRAFDCECPLLDIVKKPREIEPEVE